MRTRLTKFLALVCCSGIFLSIQCPPLVVQSFKTGISSWVGGGVPTALLSEFSDAILNSLLGGTDITGT